MRSACILKYVSTVWLLLSLGDLGAQTSAIDSLIRQGTLEIYEHPDRTIEIGHRIIALRKDDVRMQIKALILISDAYSSKRDYHKAVDFLIKAQQRSEKLNDPITTIRILTKAAVQYQQLRIYEKAIRYLDQARVLSLGYPVKDSIQSYLGTNYTIRGFIYKEQLDCSIAIEYFDRGIEEYRKLKSRLRNSNLSIINYNKGNCYIQLSDNAKARVCFDKAFDYAKTLDAKSLQAFAQKGLAEVHTREGRYTEAIRELSKARQLSADVGDLVLNQAIYRGLAINHLAINDWDRFQFYQHHYLAIQGQLVRSERKSIDIALGEQAKSLGEQAQLVKRNYIVAIGAFVIALAALVFFIQRLHKRSKRKIDELKNAIVALK